MPGARIYNLGASGLQSDDILLRTQKYFPILKPHLVIYGICLNDLLPSGGKEYKNNMAWTVPLPEEVKAPFEKRTLLGTFFTESYNDILMRIDIRDDFYGDILKDLGHTQERFASDLKALNASVLEATHRPAIVIVFFAPIDSCTFCVLHMKCAASIGEPIVASTANVTLRLSEELLKKCRLLAVQQEKSLSQLIAELMEQAVAQRSGWDTAKKQACRRLAKPFDLGGKPLSRDSLYERK